MSNNAERIKFLKSARASIERDIASLEKRGGDSKAISGFKGKLAELDDQISKAESQPQLSNDALTDKESRIMSALRREVADLSNKHMKSLMAGDRKQADVVQRELRTQETKLRALEAKAKSR